MNELVAAPSVEERYRAAVACGSTRIGARASSGDVILAAAMQPDDFGAQLLRLAAEFDSAHAELERSRLIAPRQAHRAVALRAEAAALRRCASASAALRAARCLEEAAAIPVRTHAQVLAARRAVGARLGSLTRVRTLAQAAALRLAPRYKVPAGPALKLSDRALDVYLDPLCSHCDGTGLARGGYAALGAVSACRACKGTGARRDVLGNGAAETTFAAVFLGVLQRRAQHAARGMRRALSGMN